jgi:hypothetical protein
VKQTACDEAEYWIMEGMDGYSGKTKNGFHDGMAETILFSVDTLQPLSILKEHAGRCKPLWLSVPATDSNTISSGLEEQ